MKVEIRQLNVEDWPKVEAIYRQGIESGNATFETQTPSWQQWDEAHLQVCRLVAVDEQHLLGWSALSRVSNRAVYRGVAEVSVYVTQSAWGQGIGKQLLSSLVDCSEQAGVWTLQASLFPENEASLRLHLGCGFRLVGRRERIGQHLGIWRDTLLLERRSTYVGRLANLDHSQE
jgi:phosphinothricin acetyltransferase